MKIRGTAYYYNFLGVQVPILDAFNGGDTWEWSPTIDTAWHLSLGEAERKLELVHNIFPDALLLEA